MSHAQHDESSHGANAPLTAEQRVKAALEHAAHLLPDQAPIRVFIHHNTLHAFQHLHFHEAVKRAHEVYGAEPYVKESKFRAILETGRITTPDLEAALRDQFGSEDDGQLAPFGLNTFELRMLMLRHAVRRETPASLRWLIEEREEVRKFRRDISADARVRLLEESTETLKLSLEGEAKDATLRFGKAVTGESTLLAIEDALGVELNGSDSVSELRTLLEDEPEMLAASALFTRCRELVGDYQPPSQRTRRVRLPRDVIADVGGRDVYDQLFPELIRMCAAYLDEGLSHWSMPRRELGFYAAVRSLVAHGLEAPHPLGRYARRDFREQEAERAEPMQVALSALNELGIEGDEIEDFIEATLLSLPGWAGMMSRLERHADDRPHGGPPASLLDFLAVRLTYERAALRATFKGDKSAVLRAMRTRSVETQAPASERLIEAHLLFQVLSLLGFSIKALRPISQKDAFALLAAIDSFDEVSRRRVFQEAFERNHRAMILDALATFRPEATLAKPDARPLFNLITCFDEREEAFRRQVEEAAPQCVTFGAPGFFGAAMRFRAIDEPHSVPLAPVVIVPTHEIEERPRTTDADLHLTREKRRKFWARISHQAHTGTRSLWRGTLLNIALGLFATLPLLLRILSPRSAGRLRRFARDVLLPSPRTELTIHRDDASDAPASSMRGFKVDERVTRVLTVLENIGLVDNFAKLVLVLGHGASTLNNPHKSAYDCGACGGRQGGPNARVFAKMANDPQVRRGLAERGVHIPEDTWFVGGQHDTCSDAVTVLDAEHIPQTHRETFEQVSKILVTARERTAQERCRRLFSAPTDPTPKAALAHVEGRAEHLAEPRPEFGHATNAVAIVGRRGLTRGLFLDRRAFLISYDPTIDHDGKILERTLAAATPVGAGINLEYYFSHVDNERYGAGSKLPHNVTGLIGVMSGHASDLRTGLPRQMIEIHEPVRLLVIVEATPERLLEIAGRQAEVRELVVNRWVQLVSLHPETGEMQVFTDRGFEPYTPRAVDLKQTETSYDFYRGQRDYLPPARIRAGKPAYSRTNAA